MTVSSPTDSELLWLVERFTPVGAPVLALDFQDPSQAQCLWKLREIAELLQSGPLNARDQRMFEYRLKLWMIVFQALRKLRLLPKVGHFACQDIFDLGDGVFCNEFGQVFTFDEG